MATNVIGDEDGNLPLIAQDMRFVYLKPLKTQLVQVLFFL